IALMAAGGAAAVLAACGDDKPKRAPGATASPTQASVPTAIPDTETAVVLPPIDAKVVPTACDYCIVGCGYLAYTWPVGKAGGPKADENALGVDYPVKPLSGKWVSSNMHNIVEIDGAPHHVIVIPDGDTKVVNKRGNHSVRGGTLSQKLYRADGPTRDRLKTPQLRVDGEMAPITWDEAIEIVGDVSRYVLDEYSEMAWGMKQFSYAYYENTYALTKLGLAKVQTPVWAPHDKPGAGADTPGLSDAGIDAFSAAYEDWKDSEVILVSGATLYETKTIMFLDWVSPGGATLIVVNPRRDYTAAHAEARGGLHLQLIPGTDTILNNAIARVIIENGWEDSDFIARRTVDESELGQETSWRRKMFGATFDGYKDFILGDDAYTPENAERVTGVPAAKIRQAAEILARPKEDGRRPKTSMMLEKGNYWGHNYENTASLAALGLLVGAGGRPGQMQSRAGGHQRGMLSAAAYPKDKSTDEYKGNKIELNVDKWVVEDNVRFMYVIGTTWLAAMGGTQSLTASVRRLTQETGPQLTRADAFDGTSLNVERVKQALKAKADAGGMVMVQQEIYANALTEFVDVLLPAATWGEETFSRMQGERRLRIYSKIVDPPGEAKPDWWIVAQIGKRMGFDGFDWPDSNAVFEEASERSKGTVHDYAALVELARSQGKRGHDLLTELGTTGIQCPIKLEGGQMVGTVRLHQDGFGTKSGKAVFPKGDWRSVEPHQNEVAPQAGELWVTNMRTNEHWQSQFDDSRIPYRWDRFPVNFLEINQKDASDRGIESGDWVEVENDRVLSQTGQRHRGSFKAVAYVTDQVPVGVTCSYFLFGQGRLDMAANSVTSGVADPINNCYRFKLGAGRVRRTGESEFKETMSFAPRNIA
ncbi:MAG: arsenate reductase (azurin) large subunit, partial [Chloroflexi bacterium]|nr:arsenate reductase (azurin) large subunit [Chloroflexota bacterium]